MEIGSYSYEEFLRLVESFHGYMAPGVLIGGFMVDLARKHIPEGTLFDAISETPKCLPDAIQLLTPCTTGNGWLKVINLGRYALSLFDMHEGNGVRVFLDPKKLDAWPEIKTWLFKLKAKIDQDKERLLDEIRRAGQDILGLQAIQVRAEHLRKRRRRQIDTCILCGEAYPTRDGGICRGCQGETPYLNTGDQEKLHAVPPGLKALSVEDAMGKELLHDMTQIIPGKSKRPAFLHGQQINIGDLCRLQQMGRRHVYVLDDGLPDSEWVHENDAALAFAKAMAGDGVSFSEPPREGKVSLTAARSGLFVAETERLEQFNLLSGVMCASRKSYTMVDEQRALAGTRAIPLFLSRSDFHRALSVLQKGPLFRVLPMRKARVGILVTGSEIFEGLVEDKFIPIITSKVESFGCEVVQSVIVPDTREDISLGIKSLFQAGADLLVTTAGLSVDPDDVTRRGLADAGATDMLYGAPILPGAMTLLARIGKAQVIGVPACALYFKTTSFDLLLPRLLAGITIERSDLAKLGHGGLCMECKSCTYPKCPFGR
ncbi:MAG: trehalose-binding protein [Deltaproteobacteria bacterium]|nr:trehalose-binding protein [Deltaproteobacteria bacterium]